MKNDQIQKEAVGEKQTLLLSREKKKEENRREDKSAKGKFFITMIVCMIFGGFCGAAGVKGLKYLREQNWDFNVLAENLTAFWSCFGRYMMIAMNIAALPAVLFLFGRHKREIEAWDGEDDERLDEFDRKLSIDVGIPTILMLLEMFFYGIGFYGMVQMEDKESIIFVVDLILFLGGTLYLLFHQRNVINFIKEMNPEKKGSIFDFRFNRKWFESCDEAENQKIGAASYAVFRCMQGVYLFSILALTLAGFFFPICILPLTIVGFLWLAQTVIYTIKSL